MLVDDQGHVHAALAGAGSGNAGIWYLTNAGGAWSIEQVSEPPNGRSPYDGEPSIALAEDGSVWIAFTRYSCSDCAPGPSDGIFLVSDASGSWSDAVQLTGEQTYSPSLIVRGGAFHFAYAEGQTPGLRNYPIWYATGTGVGDLAIERVDRNGGYPALDLQGGTARILYSGERINFAQQNDQGSFDTSLLPGSKGGYQAVLGVQRGSGNAVAAWSAYDAGFEHLNTWYAARADQSWQLPAMIAPDTEPIALAYARSGAVQLIGTGTAESNGDSLYYAVSDSPGGTFEVEALAKQGGRDADLALDDNTGQPNVIYATEAGSSSAVWYLIGPAR